MLVSAVRKSNRRTHQELDTQFHDMVFQPAKIFHAQARKAVMPRVCARIGYDRPAFQVTDELQHAAKVERDAVLEDPHGLRPEDFRVPAGSLLEIAARHGDMSDVAPSRDRAVVQQPFGGPDFWGKHIHASRIGWPTT